MESALLIVLCIVSLICILGGLNLLTKGAKSFLPETIPTPPVLDNLFRFLSGIYFGLGFLMAWVVYDFHRVHGLIYFIGLVVIFSGLGRFYSKMKVGSAGKYFDNMMRIEIILGVAIVALQFFR